MNEEQLEKTLESLYIINKHAKKYAEQGTENYRKGKKTTAKANSHKKKALYQLKEKVLIKIKDEVEKIEIHKIDGEKYYCFFFDDFSFHCPIHSLEIDEDRVEGTDTLEDFEKTSEKEAVNKSLKASLKQIEDEFGLNANEFLPEKKLSYGFQRYFIGWEYLGGGSQ